MLINKDYYKLLELEPGEKNLDLIKTKYNKKIEKLSKTNVKSLEIYQTAYLNITDPVLKKRYDEKIGIYKELSFSKKIISILNIITLTIFEIIIELYYSVMTFFVLATIYYYFKNKLIIINTFKNYKYLILIMILCLIFIIFIHPKVRYHHRKFRKIIKNGI